jgi:FkbM family methyltransferase
MSIYEGFVKYYTNFGIRGILVVSANRLFGHPRQIKTRPPGARNPVAIRIRSTDFLVYKEIFLNKQYDLDLALSPKVIVDGGANIGMSSIYFANRYPEAKIIAVEAEASNFAVLLRNVRSYPTIVPVHAALWNRDGQIVVSAPDPATGAYGEWGFVTHEEGVGDQVRAVTMETLMRELGISSIDLVKLDIEGAEQEVFENTRWLKGVGCLMIELHDKIRSGCTNAVEPAMAMYTRMQRGETTLYVRKGV